MKSLKKARHPVSFIFPWNREGRFSLLHELGFVVYRGKEIKLSYPSELHGLWNINQSYYLSEKSLNIEAFSGVLLIRRLIDLAIENGWVLHIWTHPWNIALNGNPERFIEKIMKPFLNYAVRKRNSGFLWIATMRELANHCESRKNCMIETFVKERNEIRLTTTCSVDSSRFDFPPALTLRIKIPSVSDVLEVLINEKKVSKENYWTTTKKDTKYFFLTLSFENLTNRVQILTRNTGKDS